MFLVPTSGLSECGNVNGIEILGLNFSINDNCTACMACVRVCPVEAISVTPEELHIVKDSCIECGLCVPACFHEAIDVHGELDRCRASIEANRAALILPTEAIVFFYPATPEQLINACFTAGFERIYFETVGDELVAGEYLSLWRDSGRRSWLRSTSPIVVNYCRTKLPELLPFLAPIVTPAVALGRYIRQMDGSDLDIVYAGVGAPGVNGDQSAIDICVSFNELETLLEDADAAPLSQSLTVSRIPPDRHRHLSVAGGLPLAMLDEQKQTSRRFKKERGLESLPAVARAVIGDETALGFVDVLPFEGNLGHPGLGPMEDLFWRKDIAGLAEPSRSDEPVVAPLEVDLNMSYDLRHDAITDVDPEAVRLILEKIGTTPEGKHWNTGSCGHPTCVEFAMAVARGRSTLALCPIFLNRQYEQAAKDALHDGLTGAFTFRVLNERLAEELSRAGRTGTSLALLFVDLDHFKTVNDTHGHGVGNQILRGVADVLEEATRSTDIVCRYGGDEFVIVLVNPDREAADRIADQIRTDVKALRVPVSGGDVGVTLSIGVAYHSGVTRINMTSEELMAEADAALYVAKAQGGNTVHPIVGGELVT
jgi:diguanylate cyclase (GGDEF)-like protein